MCPALHSSYGSGIKIVVYCHIHVHTEIYIYIYIYTGYIPTQWSRQTQWQRRRKFSLTKFLPLTLFVSFERVVQSFRVRGSWRPNITEIFWSQSYGRQRCVFLVLHGCSTGARESTLLGAGFPYNLSSTPSPTLLAWTHLYSTVQFVGLILPSNSHAGIWTRLHASAISSDIWPLGCVTSASLEWPVWLSSSGNNCRAVQRSLSSGASAYESIMAFLLPRPVSSANFRSPDFLS